MHGRPLEEPLTDDELDQLAAFLATTRGALKMPEAHGFLTAGASAPAVLPSAWQPVLLGDGFTSMEQAKLIIGLVTRLYNEILTALADVSRWRPTKTMTTSTRGVRDT